MGYTYARRAPANAANANVKEKPYARNGSTHCRVGRAAADPDGAPSSLQSMAQRGAAEREAASAVASESIAGLGFRLQAKLEVSTADDPLEREADKAAERVMLAQEQPQASGSHSNRAPARRIVSLKRVEPVARAAAEPRAPSDGSPSARSDEFAGRIAALRGRGLPLAPRDQAFFGQQLGSDFSRVRVHADGEAGAMARSLRARAFTVGPDIVFAPGQYATGSREGRRLLAHELTHVVQQGYARDPSAPSPAGRAVPGMIYRAPAGPTADDPAHAADPFDESAYASMGYWWRSTATQSTKPTLAEVRAAIVASGQVDETTLAESAETWVLRGPDQYPYWSFRHPSKGVVARAAVLVAGWSREEGTLFDICLFAPPSRTRRAVRVEPPSAMMLQASHQVAEDAVPCIPVDTKSDIDWGIAGRSFASTAATGLAVVAGAGLLVGLEVLTLGQVTWLLVGLGLASGGKALVDRRQEAQDAGVEVPFENSVIHAAGDVVGASPLVEGLSGTRLGTEQTLSTEDRSQLLGSGLGGVATAWGGPKTFAGSTQIGLRRPGGVPASPGGATPLPRIVPVRTPAPHPAAGPVERAMAEALPAEVRLGFYRWMEETHSTRKTQDVEAMLSKMPPHKIEATLREQTKAYRAELDDADAAVRTHSDPLDPALKYEFEEGGVKVKFSRKVMSDGEIDQALEISAKTGETFVLFSETPMGGDYPGIDGVSETSGRPVSLKRSHGSAKVNLVRVHAVDALVKARDAGYSHVEVHITMHGSTMAQVKAAWNGTPGHHRGSGPIFDDRGTIARYVIHAGKEVFVVAPTPKLMVPLQVPSALSDQEEAKSSE
ncbi:DUF4157 domain-containing protein [Nannocystis sp. RBIL2]|uniref:eCIS core domain-containing protein n=1 Tax=Nannocystis sp. RBIL2 TaxID=2996788 RepID=UPI00226E2A8B|nr:DUF4157 domain-containing protein [Nannocystis sp. RBIL2]MCY1064655.1 DUF4157 domain-containing protein [Nannocystis sp. RBIL2]